MILSNVANFQSVRAGAGSSRAEREAQEKERELVLRLRAMPDGESKAAEAKVMTDRVRTFMGYREYPKYHMVSRYFVYKQALLHEAERLVQARVLRTAEDIFSLRFEELQEVVRAGRVDDQLIAQRKDALQRYRALTPPRVLTSDGEVVGGDYRRDDVPAGALVGLPASAGTVEGGRASSWVLPTLISSQATSSSPPTPTRAGRRCSSLSGPGDGGGRAHHPLCVIAREYGLPAVVGVERAPS